MTNLSSGYVIDASAIIKIYVREEDSEEMDRLIEASIGQEIPILSPELLFAECANILWKKVRRDGQPREKVLADMEDLRGLDLTAVPTRKLCQRALEIACIHDISAYDACYVALSEQERLPLLTADGKLVARLSNTSFNLTLLGT
jgi:predicted nucleic acid-binding protein